MTQQFGMGWQRDIPDIRDYSVESNDELAAMFKGSQVLTAAPQLAAKVDLTRWCSPIEDQSSIGSCTAQAGVGLLEYFEIRAFRKHLNASRLFLYKTTRNYLQWTGDTGAYLRSTMAAMVLFGVPPERYWPYDISRYDDEPSSFLYSFGASYKSIKYHRLDPPNLSGDKILSRVKMYLAARYPSMFGFTVYNYGNSKGEFAFPGSTSSVLGGHAVVAVGYDDNRKIGSHKGALKIRNSWGTGWGEAGYGWLPYAYVEQGLAVDFWSLFRAEYVPTARFD